MQISNSELSEYLHNVEVGFNPSDFQEIEINEEVGITTMDALITVNFYALYQATYCAATHDDPAEVQDESYSTCIDFMEMWTDDEEIDLTIEQMTMVEKELTKKIRFD